MMIPAWLGWTVFLSMMVGVVLSACKLFGLVAWPWWLVLLPFLPMAAIVIAFILALLAWQARGCP